MLEKQHYENQDNLVFSGVFEKLVYIRTREHGVLPYNDNTNFINKIIRII